MENIQMISVGIDIGTSTTQIIFSSLTVQNTMSGLLVLPADSLFARRYDVSLRHMLNRAKSVCIQCTFCSQNEFYVLRKACDGRDYKN